MTTDETKFVHCTIEVYDIQGVHVETFPHSFEEFALVADPFFTERFRNRDVSLIIWRNDKPRYSLVALEWWGDCVYVGWGRADQRQFSIVPVYPDEKIGHEFSIVQKRHFNYMLAKLDGKFLKSEIGIVGYIYGRSFYHDTYLLRVPDDLGRWIEVDSHLVDYA